VSFHGWISVASGSQIWV